MNKSSSLIYIQLIIIICGLLILALGFFSLLGLQPSHLPLPQIEEIKTPMVYDSALGFFMAGIGLIAIFSNLKFLTFISGMFLVLLGIGNILQQIFNVNWNIIHLVFTHILQPQNQKLENMELLAAGFFIIIGFLFWIIYHYRLFSKRSIIIIALSGSIIFCIGILHLFGYLTSTTQIPGSATSFLSPLARNTALGFILIGLSIIFYSIILGRQTTYRFNKSRMMLVAVISGMISLLVWRQLITHEHLSHAKFTHATFLISKELILASIFGAAIYYLQRTKSSLKKLKRSYSLTKATLETTAEGIFVIDNNEKIVATNKKLLIMWNVPFHLSHEVNFQIVLDFVLSQLKNKEDFTRTLAHLKRNPKDTAIMELDLKNGSIFEMYSIPQRLENLFIGRVFSFHDITHLKEAENKLLYHATHDLLTGLANRGVLLQRIQEAIVRSKINNTHLAILFLDLDRFKLINDSLGHLIGDSLLKAISIRLRSSTRKQDTLARLGGDEFVVLITSLHNPEHIHNIVHRYSYSFTQPFHVDHHELFINCSIGISLFPQDGEFPESLLEKADLAMYKAKKIRKPSQMYSSEMHRELIWQLSIENELPHALSRNQFILYYQPIIDLKEKKISSIEALIRWKHPKFGLQLPQNFINIAENIGIMPSIGDWVLREACHQFEKWYKTGVNVGERVSINLSESQLRQLNFANQLITTLHEIAFDPKHLEVELNENMFMDSPEEIIINIEQLNRAGITISIDDFGIGHSSLTLIKQLPIHKLKIDKSFISPIIENKNAQIIVQAMLFIGKKLNFIMLAEGVETQEQLDLLTELKFDEIQGFYFATPLDVITFEEKISAISQSFFASN